MQPFRVPTSSMEPTLSCARPTEGCSARFNDRVLVAKIVYRFRDPHRGEIAVFHAPPAAKERCSEGGTFLKRVIGLPGETVSEKNGFFYVDGRKLAEPYSTSHYRDSVTSEVASTRAEAVLHDGRQPHRLLRLAHVGAGAAASFIGPVVATYWPP